MKSCVNCGKELVTRHQNKYCSNRCQIHRQHGLYIEAWKGGNKDGNRGISAKNISMHLKRYLVGKYGEQCSLCGWNKRHKKTGRVPLEVDHKDGNADNNNEANLRMLCPNCHSLTSNFRNLNKGRGREWRLKK